MTGWVNLLSLHAAGPLWGQNNFDYYYERTDRRLRLHQETLRGGRSTAAVRRGYYFSSKTNRRRTARGFVQLYFDFRVDTGENETMFISSLDKIKVQVFSGEMCRNHTAERLEHFDPL